MGTFEEVWGVGGGGGRVSAAKCLAAGSRRSDEHPEHPEHPPTPLAELSSHTPNTETLSKKEFAGTLL